MKMYSDFKKNFMFTIASYMIINIYMVGGEKIVIGSGGIPKDLIHFKSFGFAIEGQNSYKWYNYANIIKIEVYGHEL